MITSSCQNTIPRESLFTQMGSKSNGLGLPAGHTCQLSPSASRWASQLISSAGGGNGITKVPDSKGNSPFFQEWKDKVPKAAGCMFWPIKYVICQNHFSLNTLMEMLGRAILMISILIPYSVVSFSPQILHCSGSSIILLLWIIQLDNFPGQRVSVTFKSCLWLSLDGLCWD